MNDYVLTDASIVDGSGSSAYRGHVAVRAGRISELVPHGQPVPSAATTIDCDGKTVTPGFIDMHAHSDLAVLGDHGHMAKVAQGVTLEVCGQDGLSYAPVDDHSLEHLQGQLAAWNETPDGLDWNWRSVDEYLTRVDGGAPVNLAYLVPQGSVRLLAVGDEQRPATDAELDTMRRLVAEAMEQGAVGISSGLTYAPSSYADTQELIELARVAGSLGGFYAPHHRSYGRGALEAYEEMVHVCRVSGCGLHLAHAVIDFPENAGRDRDLLRLIDGALNEGIEVTFDTYPYLAANTRLGAMMPGWVHSGGDGAAIERLSDPATRDRIRHEMEVVGSDGAFGVPMGWELFEISGVRSEANRRWVGKTVTEAAAEAGQAPADFYFDLLIEDEMDTLTLIHMGHEEHVRNCMQHRAHTVGSDGVLVGDKPHPRGWGTFPRYLGHYSRDLGLLRLEECVAHMTSVPAARLRLRDRGLVAPGYAADLVVLDAQAVADQTSYDDPRRHPVGIEHVMVNGALTLRDGARTDALPGKAMRRGRDTH
jgi:N-acyl-D-amino-acid deacylase